MFGAIFKDGKTEKYNIVANATGTNYNVGKSNDKFVKSLASAGLRHGPLAGFDTHGIYRPCVISNNGKYTNVFALGVWGGGTAPEWPSYREIKKNAMAFGDIIMKVRFPHLNETSLRSSADDESEKK